MIDLGTVRPGSTIRIPFSSFDKDDGSSITMTNYAAADILVYKDGSTTERASTSGFTATTDFDTKTGKHLAIIDLADDTTADFFKAGSEYLVAIDAVTVDAVTTGGWIARFRIGYPNAYFDTSIATLASQTSFTLTAGPAEDDALNGMVLLVHDKASAVQVTRVVVEDYTGASKTVTLRAVPAATFTIAAGDNVSGVGFDKVDLTHIAGAAVSTTTAQLGVNAVQAGGTAWGSGAITAASIASDAIAAAKIAAGAITSAKFAAGAIDAAAIADGAIDAATFAAGAINAAAIAADAIGASELAADAAAEIADAIWDEARAGHVAAGSFGEGVASVQGNVTGNVAGSVGSVTGAVGSVTGNVGGNVAGSVGSVTGAVGSVTGAVGSVTGAVGSVTGNVGGNVTGSIGSLATQAKADVNAEVLDVLNVDTFAEPGQEAPAATNTLAKKIGYLFKFLRNKLTQTATELKVYADDGTTVDQKSTISDDATTYTRGEIGTGP